MRTANLALAFFLELAVMAALALLKALAYAMVVSGVTMAVELPGLTAITARSGVAKVVDWLVASSV